MNRLLKRRCPHCGSRLEQKGDVVICRCGTYVSAMSSEDVWRGLLSREVLRHKQKNIGTS